MLIEAVRICDSIEPLVSILYDKNVDALLTCTYSKNTQQRSGRIRILDKLTLEDLFSLRLSSAAFHLEFQAHANLYVTGLGDGQIALFDAKTRSLQVDRPNPFAGHMVTDAKLSNDCQRVAFTDESSALRVYERESAKIIYDQEKTHVMYGQTVDAWCCSFLSDANLVASGGDDNTLKVWDIRESGNRPTQINKSHSGGVVRLRLAPNGQLCTGSYDGHLRFFDLRRMDETVSSVKVRAVCVKDLVILFSLTVAFGTLNLTRNTSEY